MNLKAIDPAWAWSEFQPSADQPWTKKLAAHLFRRAGFAASQAQLETAVLDGPSRTVDKLIAPDTGDEAQFESTADTLARTILAGGDPEKLSAAWTYRLLHTPHQLLEKTTLFWHGHFATSAAKVQDPQLMWNQNRLLRKHALGSFPALVQGIAQDPAMLIYLDSATNRKSRPNENFARELMELFCLGEGHYTEVDVQELSRCFTGWEIKNKKFRKNRYQQDRGQKSVLGHAAAMDGEEAIQVVLNEASMPRFICRKLVRFFVCDEPEIEDLLLAPLAKTFEAHDRQIAPVIRQLLRSNFFFSEHSFARKVRSPVELCMGVLRALEATTNTVKLSNGLKKTGQGLFYPPNVKGWDGGRAWINSSTLLGRTNLLGELLSEETTRFSGSSLIDFLESKSIADASLVDWLEVHLFATSLRQETREMLSQILSKGEGNREQRLRSLLLSAFALPEFQLG